MQLHDRVQISIGCLEWMQREIQTLRSENKDLKIEINAINRVLTLTEEIRKPSQGFGMSEDRFYQAKKEIQEAIKLAEEAKEKKVTDVAI